MKKKVLHIIGTMSVGGGSKNVKDLLQIDEFEHEILDLSKSSWATILRHNFSFLGAPDIVHVHGPKPLVVLGIGLLRNNFYKANLIFTPHGFNPNFATNNLLKTMYYFLAKNMVKATVSKIVCVSAAEISNMEKDFPKTEKILIYNGIECKNAILTFERKYKKKEKIKILLVGRFDKIKNYESLIPLADSNKNLQFFVVGGGSEFFKIDSQVKKNKIENIYLIGELENSEFNYASFDYFLSLSKSEGMPYSVLEALSSNVWPILSDIPAHREIVKLWGAGSVYSLGSVQLENHIETLSEFERAVPFPEEFYKSTMLKRYAKAYKRI